MVEDIEEFGAKLKARALAKRDVFADAEVHLPTARSASDVAGCVAECASGRNGKGGRVDPLADGRACRGRERNAGHEVGTLIVGVAVGNRRRRAIDQNVDRESGAGHERGGDSPATGNGPPEAGFIQEFLALSERKLIDGVGIENVTDIPNARSALACGAGDVFRYQRIAIAATVGAIIDFMRPHVIGREQETSGERPLHGKGKGVEVAVVFVTAPGHLAKALVRTSTSRGIDHVHFRQREQMNALTAYIGGSSNEVSRQLLLYRQAPLFYVRIFSAAVIVAG